MVEIMSRYGMTTSPREAFNGMGQGVPATDQMPFLDTELKLDLYTSFMKRIIRDVLSMEYVGVNEALEKTIFDNYGYNNPSIFPFQELLFKIIGGRGYFRVVFTDTVLGSAKSPNTDSKPVGYSWGSDGKEHQGKPDSIAYNLDFIDVNHLKYIFSVYNKIHLNMNNNINLANLAILKIENGKESIESVEVFEQKVRVLKKAIQEGDKLPYMGDGDDIDIKMISLAPYREAVDLLDNEIARVTGLPLTYIQGKSADGMNATGEGDRIQKEEAFYALAKNLVIPILQKIQDEFLGGGEIGVKKSMTLHIQEVNLYAQTVERLDIEIPEDKKQKIEEFLTPEFLQIGVADEKK